MAVTNNPRGRTVEMTAAADQVAVGMWVKSVRLTGGATTTIGDVVLVDPVDTNQELWRTRTTGANYAEAELIERLWPNGARVGTFGITAGVITIAYE